MLEIIKEACLSDKDEPLAKGDVLTKKATNKILRQTKKVTPLVHNNIPILLRRTPLILSRKRGLLSFCVVYGVLSLPGWVISVCC